MATIICDDKEYAVPDMSPLRGICEDELDVAFGCNSGYCGICQIEILEGEDNLDDLTEAEQDLGMSKHTRFACQCKIKSGRVKIRV
jgi:ferredoxin